MSKEWGELTRTGRERERERRGRGRQRGRRERVFPIVLSYVLELFMYFNNAQIILWYSATQLFFVNKLAGLVLVT